MTRVLLALALTAGSGAALASFPPNTCPNATVEGLEECDDNDTSNNDACSYTCTHGPIVDIIFADGFDVRPETTITRRPPPVTNNSGSVTVVFSSDVVGATFECVLNGGLATACTSPKVYGPVAPGTSFTIQVTAIDPAGNRDLTPAYAITSTTVAVNPPPLLYYPFDGNGANQGAASGFPATFSNVSFPAGKFGSAVKFNGTATTSATIAGTNASFWRSTSSRWTIGFWFRQDVQVNPSFLMSMRGSQGWETYDGVAPGSNLFTCATPNGCINFAAPALSTWHHLLYRYDAASYTSGAALDIYLDDVLVGSIPGAASPLVGTATPDLVFGAAIGLTSHYYVDDLKVFDNVYSVATQCTLIIGGTWTGASCAVP